MEKSKGNERILNLILTFKWFEKIKSGEKKEENRAISDYNLKLMCLFDKKGVAYDFKPFEIVRFRKGYTSEFVDVEIKGIFLDTFIENIPEGMKKGDQCITIDLGNIVSNV